MPKRPVLVFVAGALHGPETWEKVIPKLEAHNYKCHATTHPTLSSPSATLADDVQEVRDVILSETTQGNNDVVVIVHSYGGLVGASAIKGLTKSNTLGTDNAQGHVIGLFMIACGFAVDGKAFLDHFGGNAPPSWDINKGNDWSFTAIDPRLHFYHDLPEDEADYYASKLRKQSTKAFSEGGEAAYAGWKDVPVWYLAALDDKGLPIEAQRAFVQSAKDEGGDIVLREVQSSHSPMLSKPAEVVQIVLEALGSFERL